MSAITPRGLEINLDAALPLDAIRVARHLLRTSRGMSLATIDPSGYPYSTMTNLVVEPDGTPFFYASGMTLHARNLDGDERLSITVAEPGPDMATAARLTLTGRAVRVSDEEKDALSQRYVDNFPKAKLYLSLRDTRLYRIRIEGVQLNGGPARNANDVKPADLVKDLADAKDLMAQAGDILAALNADDRASRLAAKAGGSLGRWRVTSIDPEGVDLASAQSLARLWLPHAVNTVEEFHKALAEVE